MANENLEFQIQDGSFEFLAILLEGLPFIFLGTLVSGFLGTYLPKNAFERWLPKNRTLAILMSGVLGAIFPVCECAVVPVIRRLVKNGLPVSCALTYMLAAPIFNPVTAISTFKAFDNYFPTIASARLLMGFGIAVIVGMLMARIAHEHFLKPSVKESGHDHQHPRNLTSAMNNSLRDLMDVGLYFTIGVVLTAMMKSTVIDPTSDFWKGLEGNSMLGTPLMMALAFILSLCSTSDAFIAANIGNFKYGPKLAFMVFGPMMDAKLIFLYSTVFKWKFIASLLVGLFILSWASSIAAETIIENFAPEIESMDAWFEDSLRDPDRGNLLIP